MRQLILASAIAFGVVASLIGAGLGVGLLLLILLGGSAAGPMADSAPQVVTASLALGVMTVSVGLGLALAWSAWRSLARTPARPWQWPAWGWWLLAFIAVVGTGQAVFQAGWYVLMPVAHLTATALATFGVLALALGGVRRYVRPPSTRAATGSLAWGGLAAVGLALAVEVVLAIAGLVIFSIWLNATQPELVSALQAWAQRLQGGPPGALRPLAPPPDVVSQLFRSPWVILAILGFVSVLVPLIEEIAKGLAVPLIALAGGRLRLADGFLLGAAAGAGLALVEGVFIGALGLMAPENWAGAMLSRGAATTMHCAASGLAGLGWALMLERRWLAGLGLGLAAVTLHGAWNAAAIGLAARALVGGGNALAALFVGYLGILWLLAALLLAVLPGWLAQRDGVAPI